MARVNFSPEGRGQFAAIARVRWQLFVNSLRKMRGRLEFVSRILVGLGFGAFGLGGAVGLGSAAWVFVSRDTVEWIAIFLWVVLLFWQGHQTMLEFVTGYVLELSLSVDNLFLFLVIFRYFSVPEQHQRKVLFWGILGALLMRGIFIFAGVGLITRFHWILYLLGALLILAKTSAIAPFIYTLF